MTYMVCVGGGCVSEEDKDIATIAEASRRAHQLVATGPLLGQPVTIVLVPGV